MATRFDGRDLSLRALASLVVLVEEGHFGRAAAKLFVSAPALSQQVRRLEAQVGARLVERGSHPVRPTDAGHALLPHARRLLQTAEDAADAVARVTRRESGALRVGFINGGGGTFSMGLLSRLGTQLELVLLDWPDQVAAVARGHVDASFVRPPMPSVEGVRLEPIGTEPRVVALQRDHPLASRASVSIDELDDEVHVDTAGMPPVWRDWWSIDPRPSGARVRYGPCVRSIDELIGVVSTGVAMAITAASIADHYAGADVCFVRIADVEPCGIELCTRVGDPHPGVRALRAAVRDAAQSASGAARPVTARSSAAGTRPRP